MVKGYKDSTGRFHPIKPYQKIRKSRDQKEKTQGLKFNPSTKRTKQQQQTLEGDLSYLGTFDKTDIEIDPSTFLKATNNDPDWIPDHKLESLKKIKKRIEEGRVLDKPYLILIKKRGEKTEIVSHEGRHRAYTARKLGLKKIPIEVYCIKKSLFGVDCENISEEELKQAMSQLRSFKQYEKDADKKQAEWIKEKAIVQKVIKKRNKEFVTAQNVVDIRKDIQEKSEKVFSK